MFERDIFMQYIMKCHVFTHRVTRSFLVKTGGSYPLHAKSTSAGTLSLTSTLGVVSEMECLSTKPFTFLHQVSLKIDDMGLEVGWPESKVCGSREESIQSGGA